MIAYVGPAMARASYEAVVAGSPDVEVRGKTLPYTSRNGHMFSFLDVTGSMAIRLGPDQRKQFLDRYDTSIASRHGREMKDFVVVPAALLADTEQLQPWFDASYERTGTLKRKPTTRKKS